ncbi:MAG: carbohydrate ABC transporter substrate-binding protein [Anaerolineaceae bacterium]|nr:carbohydrate ABC transporter substrate-binding protein [Anaerolineaceae bacterium]
MKTNLYKLIVVLMIFSIALAACTTPEPAAAPEADAPAAAESDAAEAPAAEVVEEVALSGTLTVLSNRTDLDEDGTLAQYSDAFSALYPGVTVEWETMTDYVGEVETRMNTTEYGDVLLLPPALVAEKFPQFLTPLGSVDDLGEKYNFIHEATFEGTVYGIAVVGNGQGLLYNKEVFEAAGIAEIPNTPEAFQAALALIKENTDAIPLYTNYAAGWPLTQWDSQLGSVSGNPDTKNLDIPHMDAPFAAGEVEYTIYKVLYDAVAEGYTEEDPTTTDWETSKTMIANGEIGVMALGSWAISQMQAAAESVGNDPSIIGYMPFPTNIDGNQYASAGGDYKIGINVNSENQEIAQVFLTWFLDESNFAYDQGGIPPLKSAALPSNYDAFAEAGVEWIVDTAANPGEEGLYNSIDNEAEVGFSNGSGLWQSRIVDAAKGQSGETFEDIMNEANTRWAEARVSLGVTP